MSAQDWAEAHSGDRGRSQEDGGRVGSFLPKSCARAMAASAQFPTAMTSAELVAGRFDYSQVDADVAAEMRGAAERVRQLVHASVIEVGRQLLAIKRRLDQGQFVAWVQRECQLPLRTAQRAMQAAEMVAKNDKLSFLAPDGLLALASRKAPAPIVAEIIEQIEAGAQPTAADIKRQITAAVREAKAARREQTPGREEKRKEGGEAVSATAAEAAGPRQSLDPLAEPASMEARSPSPEEELATLVGAWERAGREVREAFLGRIGAVFPTAAPIEEVEQEPTASAEPAAAVLEPPDDDSLNMTAPIAEAEQLPTASSEPAPAASERPDPGDLTTTMANEEAKQPWTASPRAPAAAPERSDDDGSPEVPNQRPTGSPDPITAVSAPPCNNGGPPEAEVTLLNKGWFGHAPPPEVTCHTKDGTCGYIRCATFGRCLTPQVHEEAAA